MVRGTAQLLETAESRKMQKVRVKGRIATKIEWRTAGPCVPVAAVLALLAPESECSCLG